MVLIINTLAMPAAAAAVMYRDGLDYSSCAWGDSTPVYVDDVHLRMSNIYSWAEYEFSVPEDGKYVVLAKYRRYDESGSMKISAYVDAVLTGENYRWGNDGSWVKCFSDILGGCELASGIHTLRIEVSDCFIDLNGVALVKTDALPVVLSTNECGIDTDGYAYCDVNAVSGGVYRLKADFTGNAGTADVMASVNGTGASGLLTLRGESVRDAKYFDGLVRLSAGNNRVKIENSGGMFTLYSVTFEFVSTKDSATPKLPELFKDCVSDTTVVTGELSAGSYVAQADVWGALCGKPVTLAAAVYNDEILNRVFVQTEVPYENNPVCINFQLPEGIGDYCVVKLFLLENPNTVRPLARTAIFGKRIYKQLYVSPDGNDNNPGSAGLPFKTIKRAKQEVSDLNGQMNGDIIVNLESGIYQLSETEIFTERHGGKNGYDVIFRGSDRGEKPVISGGTRVTGWERTEKPEIFKARVSGVEDSRTLYVNGYAAQRARSKYLYEGIAAYTKPSSAYGEDGFTVSTHNFPVFSKPGELELVWRLSWTHQRMPVENIVRENNTYIVTMDQPYWDWCRRIYPSSLLLSPGVELAGVDDYSGVVGKLPFYIENAMELLDEPGEFYFDKAEQTVYYYPFYEENLDTAEVYMGTTEFLIKAGGSSLNSPLTNLVFENLSFRYGAWNEANETGKQTIQADKLVNGPDQMATRGAGKVLPAQLQFDYAKDITINNCSFVNLGSGAVSMINGVRGAVIKNSLFSDISGAAVIVGSWNHATSTQRTSDVTITNNVINRAANEFTDTCGVSMYYADNVSITHNSFYDLPYSGISAGWGWNTYYDDPSVCCQNLNISYNYFENCMRRTSDGGAVYTLGNFSNGIISNNYIYADRPIIMAGGLYFDMGTTGLRADNNVLDGPPTWSTSNPINHDIFGSDNFAGIDEKYDIEAYHSGNSRVMTNTTYVPDRDFSKYPAAVAVMENAGVEKRYNELTDNLKLPRWRTDFMMSEACLRYTGENGWTDVAGYIDYYDTHRYPGVYNYYRMEYSNCIGDTGIGEWVTYKYKIRKSGWYQLAIKGGTSELPESHIPYARFYLNGNFLADIQINNVVPGKDIVCDNYGARVWMNRGEYDITVELYNWNFMMGPFKFDNGELKTENDDDFEEGVIAPRVEYQDPPAVPEKQGILGGAPLWPRVEYP